MPTTGSGAGTDARPSPGLRVDAPSPRIGPRGPGTIALVDWTFIYLMFVLKIPIIGLLWIVWWAIHQTEDEEQAEGGDGGTPRPEGPRRPSPPVPRRAAHREPAPPPPARTRSGGTRDRTPASRD